jgi:hypothetical protein
MVRKLEFEVDVEGADCAVDMMNRGEERDSWRWAMGDGRAKGMATSRRRLLRPSTMVQPIGQSMALACHYHVAQHSPN